MWVGCHALTLQRTHSDRLAATRSLRSGARKLHALRSEDSASRLTKSCTAAARGCPSQTSHGRAHPPESVLPESVYSCLENCLAPKTNVAAFARTRLRSRHAH